MDISDNILSLISRTPDSLMSGIAQRVKQRRLENGWTQKMLATKAGISLPSYRCFESSGEISLRSLVMLAFALNMKDEFKSLFNNKTYQSLDDIPLLRIEEHCKKYGKFAIGLDKEIISEIYNNQINPVWYMESKNVYDFKKNYSKINYYNMKNLYRIMGNKSIVEDMVKNKDVHRMYMKKFMNDVETKVLSNYLLGYTKDRKANNTSFYDEREWRALLPDDEDIAEWIWDIDKGYFNSHKKEWNNFLCENKEYGHMTLISEVINDAITHIIVDTNKRIPETIRHIMKTKTIFDVSDISYEQRLLLVSKITSFERINKDY